MEKNKYPIFGSQKKLVTFTVQFNSLGGTPTPTTITNILAGQPIAQPTNPTRGEDVFLGWYTDQTFTTQWNFSTDTVNSSFTLFAFWREDRTITFVSSGSQVSPLVAPLGTPIEQPNPPTKTGHSFIGWFTNPEFIGSPFVFSVMPSDSITLYAKFAINTYTVTFVSNGGSPEPETLTLNYDSLVPRPTDPSKQDFDFDDWYTTSTFNTKWNFNLDRVPTNNITLHAKYTPRGEIIFSDDGFVGNSQYTFRPLRPHKKFRVPDGVTSISIVAISKGENGKLNEYAGTPAKGKGGHLAYKNNIPVLPGTLLDIDTFTGQVSFGGQVIIGAAPGFYNGSPTPISVGDFVSSGGAGYNSVYYIEPAGSQFPDFIAEYASGAGGAGGYYGKGGDGATYTIPSQSGTGAGSPGGGGAAKRELTKNQETGQYEGDIEITDKLYGGYGGGTDVFGESPLTQPYSGGQNSVGFTGTFGRVGNYGEPASSRILYGAGAGNVIHPTPIDPPDGTEIGRIQEGGYGAIRIVWGKNRQFPNTNVGKKVDMPLTFNNVDNPIHQINSTFNKSNFKLGIVNRKNPNREIWILFVVRRGSLNAVYGLNDPLAIRSSDVEMTGFTIDKFNIQLPLIASGNSGNSIGDYEYFLYKYNGEDSTLGTAIDMRANGNMGGLTSPCLIFTTEKTAQIKDIFIISNENSTPSLTVPIKQMQTDLGGFSMIFTNSFTNNTHTSSPNEVQRAKDIQINNFNYFNYIGGVTSNASGSSTERYYAFLYDSPSDGNLKNIFSPINTGFTFGLSLFEGIES